MFHCIIIAMKVLFSFFVVAALSVGVHAQWTRVKLDPKLDYLPAKQILVDGSTVYAGSTGLLFRSTDSANTFGRIKNGISQGDGNSGDDVVVADDDNGVADDDGSGATDEFRGASLQQCTRFRYGPFKLALVHGLCVRIEHLRVEVHGAERIFLIERISDLLVEDDTHGTFEVAGDAGGHGYRTAGYGHEYGLRGDTFFALKSRYENVGSVIAGMEDHDSGTCCSR